MLFLVPFQNQIFDTFFKSFLDLVILPHFNAISTDRYAVKCLIFVYFVQFFMFVSVRMLIEQI